MRIISLFQKRQIPERKRAIREYKEKRGGSKFFIFSLFFLVILLFFSFFYFIFFSSIFKIKSISFEIKDHPLVKIDKQQLEIEINKILSKNFYFLTFNNLFFFPKKEIKNLLSQDKKIESFQILRLFPQGIKIKISAWQPEAIYSSNKEYFLLNKNGESITTMSEGEATLADLVIIEDRVGEAKISPPFSSIFDFIKKTNVFDFRINKIEISKEKGVPEYRAITSENWKIYFEPHGNFNEQIDHLALMMKEKITDRRKLEYIDLRFGKRIFYKYK